MGAVCVDASLILAWLLPNQYSDAAFALSDRWREDGTALFAPALVVFEVTSVLRQSVYRGQITLDEGEEAMSAFLGMGVRTVPAEALAERAWMWGRTVNASRLYDMYYVAAADFEDCVLWTLDRRLVNLVAGRASFVQSVGEAQPEATVGA